MSEDFESGVQIGDASSYVRLRGPGERRTEDEMRTVMIEVKGGEFTGSVGNGTIVGVGAFCSALQSMYDRLAGSAELHSLDNQFSLTLECNRGHINGMVELCDNRNFSKLIFEIGFDQTYLPNIIRGLKEEFPSG